MIAELLCAWFAGVVLGWQLGFRRRGVDVHHWIVNDERPPFDWAKEHES